MECIRSRLIPQLQQTLGVLSISFGLAFLMNITVESPVGHLDNFIFNRFVAELIDQPQTHKEAEVYIKLNQKSTNR